MPLLKSRLDLLSRVMCTFHETKPKSLETLSKCCQHQGLDFLTKVMPLVGKVLDSSLTYGRLQSLSGITKTYKGTHYPVFLREYFELIFDLDGHIREEVDGLTIKRLRTILYFYYKLELPFTDDQLFDAKVKFKMTDGLVKTSFTEFGLAHIKRKFTELLPADPMDIRGRHSNGATADGYNGIERRNIVRYIPSLMSVYGSNYFFNSRDSLREYTSFNHVVCTEPSSKVSFVPKDSRGPRTICMEPHERMYAQQGLMHSIYEHIEKYSDHKGRINFTDQSVNRELAYKSSMTRDYATIDMKDASDLVSWELIKLVAPENYVGPLMALRTPTARLDDEVVELKKFAPMGSALCFPIEAILFYSIATIVTPDVFVYGDDIIVPTDQAYTVMMYLEYFGLIVNKDKSLVSGYFRESCGFDAYKGNDITPIRYRRDDLISVVALANNLCDQFGTSTGLAVIEWYESINQTIILRLPSQLRGSDAIAFYSEYDNRILFKRRYNPALQAFEFRVLSTAADVRAVLGDSLLSLYDYLATSYHYNNPTEDSTYVEPYTALDRHSLWSNISVADYIDNTMIATGSRYSLSRERICNKWVILY